MGNLKTAIEYITKNDLEKAKDILNALLIEDQKNDEIYVFLAKTYEKMKDKKNAAENAEKAIEINSNHAPRVYKILYNNKISVYYIQNAKQYIDLKAFEILKNFKNIESFLFDDGTYNYTFLNSRKGDLVKRILLRSIKEKHLTFVSPYTGKKVSTNKSIGEFAYYFKDENGDFIVSFYSSTMNANSSYQILLLDSDTLIYGDMWQNRVPEGIFKNQYVNLLKILYVHKHSIRDYIENDSLSKVLVKNLDLPHLGHTVWNSLSVWSNVINENYLQYIDHIILENGIVPREIIKFADKFSKKELSIEEKDFNHYVFDHNVFMVTLLDDYIFSDLGHMLIRNAFQNITVEEKKDLSTFRHKYFPIVLLSLRFGTRECENQEMGITNMIKKLENEFPHIGFIIDGMNSVNYAMNQSHRDINMDKEIEYVKQFENRHNIISTVNKSLIYSIVWTEICDLFIAPWGAGLAKYKWINNKKGIIHAPKCVLDEKHDLHLYDSTFYREYAVEDIWLDSRYSSNEEYANREEFDSKAGANKHYFLQNYKCDWSAIFDLAHAEIVKIQKSKNEILDRQIKNLRFLT